MKLEVCYMDGYLNKLEKNEKGDCIDIRVSDVSIGYRKNIILNKGLENINDKVYYHKGDILFIDFGIVCRVPSDKRINMYTRSSTFKKYGLVLTNSLGIIDHSFNGLQDSLCGMFYALEDGFISHNDRIAQIEIVDRMDLAQDDIIEIDISLLNDNSRGGYGSSGHK